MIELKNVSKIFPGVRALDNVSASFREGEIHALLGENGAGKSTLMKVICGIHKPDEGSVYINGKPVVFKDFRDAINHDISIVNQEIQVIPESSIAENIVIDKLSRFTTKKGIDWKSIYDFSEKYLKEVGLDLDPKEKIGSLSAAQKQLVQIAKSLASDAKTLLLDEPTSSLTKHEADNLIKIVKKLKEKNVAIIFISHKIEEVLEMCDVVTVLRDGKYIGTEYVKDLDRQKIIKMMIGRETEEQFLGHLDIDYNTKALVAKNITQHGRFDNVSFDLYKGEILGFYGLVGSGRTELIKTILGEDRMDSGEVSVFGKKAVIKSMYDSLNDYRIGYVSENRKEDGLFLEESIKRNISITILDKILNKAKGIQLSQEEVLSNEMIKKLEIKTPSMEQKVKNLSGGNQQKVSIGKWLAADCDILVIDEPSVGVDVGAKEYIHDIIWKLAKEEGKSIIVISSDMPEIITLARRLLVFKENEIVGEINDLDGREFDYKEISERIGSYLA